LNLREQLPYLGEKQADGTLSIAGIQIERPDYKAFLEGSKYKSEANCIAVLLGIADVNFIAKIAKDKLLTTYANEIHIKSGVDKKSLDKKPPHLKEEIIQLSKKAFSLELIGNFKYKVLPEDKNGIDYFYLHHILKELFEDMYKGTKKGDLVKIPGPDYQFELDSDFNCLFSEYGICYDREQFLKWAENNGYKIPDELRPYLQENISDVETKGKSSFPDPFFTQSCTWEEVTITLTSLEQVRIKMPSGEKPFTYAEIGMSDGRNKENKKRIWRLLILFAQKSGIIEKSEITDLQKQFDGVGKQTGYAAFMNATKELNNHFKRLFNINESIYIGTYKKMFRNDSCLKKYRPDIFIPIPPIDGKKDTERKEQIKRQLQKKGYATKIKFKSTINNNPHTY